MRALGRLRKRAGGKPKVFPEYVQKIGRKFMEYRGQSCNKCVLCKDTPVVVDGIFVVDLDRVHEFGGIPGRNRFLFYSLCCVCAKMPDEQRSDGVEEAFKRELNAGIESVGDAIYENQCAACGGIPDMVHGMAPYIFATCSHCRDTKKDLCSVIAKNLGMGGPSAASETKPGR